MNLAKKKTHNLITFSLEKKTLRILFFTIDNTTTTTTNKPNTAMFEANTHWHCSADKKKTTATTNLRFGPLGNQPSQANITLSLAKEITSQTIWAKRHAAQLVSIATSQPTLTAASHIHTHLQSEIHTPHNYTHTIRSVSNDRGNEFNLCVVQRSLKLLPSSQLEICD